MSFEDSETVGSFATLRFSGSDLDPAVITEILGVEPTLACVKGARDPVQRKSGERLSQQGWWFLKTDKLVSSSDLAAHEDAILRILLSLPVQPHVYALPKDLGANMQVTLFWFGQFKAQAPTVNPNLLQMVAKLGGELTVNFQTASTSEGVVAA